jgi:hypothetical protein
LVKIDFVHTHNPIRALVATSVTHALPVAPKRHLLPRLWRRFDDDRRLNAFLQPENPLVQRLKFMPASAFSACDEIWGRSTSTSRFNSILQSARARRGHVILGSRRQTGNRPRCGRGSGASSDSRVKALAHWNDASDLSEHT